LDLGGSVEIGDQEIMKQRVKAAMENHFKPEFLNRIDESVIFNGLSKKDLRFIVKIETKRLEKRLEETDKTYIERCFAGLLGGLDHPYTVPSLKRAIQRELETVVARGILSGDFNDGDNVVVDMVEGRIGVRRGAPQEEPAALSGAFD
jgi:ATP-dependent Clp protease ATP-binding subunit ClpB